MVQQLYFSKVFYNFQPKALPTFKIFQQTCLWLVLKKHLHYTISRRPRTAFLNHLENKCQYIPFPVYSITADSSPLHIASSQARTRKILVSERKSPTNKLRTLPFCSICITLCQFYFIASLVYV